MEMHTAKEIMMMYGYGDHMSGWGYGLGILSMILFSGVLIVAIIAAVRYLGRDRPERFPPEPPAAASPPLNPEQVLAERFARGEIDTDEYHQRLDTLRQSGHSAAAGSRS